MANNAFGADTFTSGPFYKPTDKQLSELTSEGYFKSPPTPAAVEVYHLKFLQENQKGTYYYVDSDNLASQYPHSLVHHCRYDLVLDDIFCSQKIFTDFVND